MLRVIPGRGCVVWGCGVLLCVFCRMHAGCAHVSGSGVESPAVDGESPVHESVCAPVGDVAPSSSGLVESAVNLPGPPGKPEYLN